MTGSAPENASVGPTMVSTFSETGSRPYVDALLEVNPLDGSCSARIVVLVQSMTVVFDAVSLHMFSLSFTAANFDELLIS